MKGALLYGHSRGSSFVAESVTAAVDEVTYEISTEDLSEGVVHLTLFSQQGIPVKNRPTLNKDEMKEYAKKLSEVAKWCVGQGMPIAYHHHQPSRAAGQRKRRDLRRCEAGQAARPERRAADPDPRRRHIRWLLA